MIKGFKEVTEARGDTAVFTFGRFNPPTTGHEKLIEAVAKQQSKNAGSKMYVYPSKSQDAKKNPLPYAKKIAYMRKMFKKYAKNIVTGNPRTAIEVAVELYKKGHSAIVMVVGSDRVREFETILNEYNGVEGKRHGYYGFDNIEVVSAGERDPDAEGVAGMSASKMRAAAMDGKKDDFMTGLPSSFKDGEKLYRDIRSNMGVREERDMGDMTDFEYLRDQYLTGKVWKLGDQVEANNVKGEVVRRGTNYLTMVEEDGKVHKVWLHDITLDERNYRKEYDNYQGRPEQIARRSSRNKARRVMGDRTKIGKDVGHKDNDPMNNDPKNLRNEDPAKNRREPRLREEDDLDEMSWYRKVIGKIHTMTHPKGYEAITKEYAQLMTQKKYKGNPRKAASDVARQYKNVDARVFVNYINKLVAKDVLPQELKAEHEIDESKISSFKDFVDHLNNK